MTLNIGHKIFGIAIIVLVLMAIVAVFSIRMTSEISDELELVATKQLPLSDTIGQINVSILEQGILIQRLFVIPHESKQAIRQLENLDGKIEANFAKAKALLQAEKNSKHPPETFAELKRTLNAVEKEYRLFEKHSMELLALHDVGENEKFHALLPDLNKQQNTIDAEISALRLHVEAIADGAIERADESEYSLLIMHSWMTLLASVLGLGFATAVTAMLVKNVRILVSANEEVEQGNLDIEVPVKTRDEVGKLTSSFNEMVGGLRAKERIKETFGKYMDPRIVSKLIDKPEFTKLGGERNEMTVMFIDLKGYTSISEKLPPHELVNMLNMFLGRMTDAVGANSGVVNDFMGDAVMAYWGPPFTSAEDHAELACKAALDARRNFALFKADVERELGDLAEGLDIDMRVGLSSGEVISGNIGSKASRKYSVIGDPVNLGSRLEGANKNYGTHIIISERTQELAKDKVNVRELDVIRVKGKTEPTRIYELQKANQGDASLEQALSAYRNQNWEKARVAFTKCMEVNPDDPVPAVFLERISYFEENPPAKNWDGVWDFLTK